MKKYTNFHTKKKKLRTEKKLSHTPLSHKDQPRIDFLQTIFYLKPYAETDFPHSSNVKTIRSCYPHNVTNLDYKHHARRPPR